MRKKNQYLFAKNVVNTLFVYKTYYNIPYVL